jgi:uncharacterized protein YbaR (Trm112 family)
MHWKDLIDKLACPACKKSLVMGPKGEDLRCTGCRRIYPVQDDIPILLVERATLEN